MSPLAKRIALAVAGVLLSYAALVAAGTPGRDEVRAHVRIPRHLVAHK